MARKKPQIDWPCCPECGRPVTAADAKRKGYCHVPKMYAALCEEYVIEKMHKVQRKNGRFVRNSINRHTRSTE